MPDISIEHRDDILSACRRNLVELARSYGNCFRQAVTFEMGDPIPWDHQAGELPDRPGAAIAVQVGAQSMLCVLPLKVTAQSSQVASPSIHPRLEVLGMEWASRLLPQSLAADAINVSTFSNLRTLTDAFRPAPHALLVELTAHTASVTDHPLEKTDSASPADTGTPSRTSTYLLLPVETPASKEARVAASARRAADHSSADGSPRHDAASIAPSERERLLQRISMLKSLPVTVAVRLAERRIEINNLLSLTPGSLITFDKSCEDLLDLFVNNQLFARGEAVKVGEKFGLKIRHVGGNRRRETKVVID